jgi:hypothetical protein
LVSDFESNGLTLRKESLVFGIQGNAACIVGNGHSTTGADAILHDSYGASIKVTQFQEGMCLHKLGEENYDGNKRSIVVSGRKKISKCKV